MPPTQPRIEVDGSNEASEELSESGRILYEELLARCVVLARRADLRGLPVETIEVRSDQAVPAKADIYLIGGGEDGPQALAAQRLNADRGLHAAVEQRAVVFCVCAGYQLLGTSFFAKGSKHAGLNLLADIDVQVLKLDAGA